MAAITFWCDPSQGPLGAGPLSNIFWRLEELEVHAVLMIVRAVAVDHWFCIG
jgi:hypothetical protein